MPTKQRNIINDTEYAFHGTVVRSYSDVSSKKTFAQLATQFIPTVLNRVIRSNVPIDFYVRTVLLLLKTTYIRKTMFEFKS